MKWGLTLFNYREIDALVRKGHTVRVFVLRNAKGLHNPRPDWDVVPLSWRHSIVGLFQSAVRRPVSLARLLKDALRTRSLIDLMVAVGFLAKLRDMDVAYVSWGDHKLFTGYYCKRMTNIPLVVCIHAYELYNNPNPKILPEALASCDRIVTVCDHNRRVLMRDYGLGETQIDVVRHTIDLDVYKVEPKIKILIVGFFSEKKGHDVLFRALKKLDRQDIELWVVGDATPDVIPIDCRRLAKQLDIESSVVFFGAQGERVLRTLYRECDVFCLPSRTALNGEQEGLPTAIAEAMAFGKPVVSTRHAGIPEAVDRVLVDENDVAQLAEALSAVCDSAELRRQLGTRNRFAAEELFSGSNTDKLESILGKIAGRPRANGRSGSSMVKNQSVQS